MSTDKETGEIKITEKEMKDMAKRGATISKEVDDVGGQIFDRPRGLPPIDPYHYAALLYKKVLKVMNKIEHLKKDDPVAFGTTKYNAISEEHVTRECRKAMIEAGLIIFPNNQVMNIREMIKDGQRVGFLTDINVLYKLCDTETGYSEFVSSSGTGVDSQDKGSGKAMTYAFKYVLLRTFMIPTGEDPDKISSEELTEEQEKEIAKIKKTKIDKAITPVTKIPTGEDKDEQAEYIKSKFPGTTEVTGFAADKEIVDLVAKAFPKNATIGMRLVTAFKGTKEQLSTLLKSRIKE